VSDNQSELRRARKKASPNDDLAIFRLKLLLGESFKFADSISQVGLQLADILASAVCRAFNGNLRQDGWEEIGELMVQRELQSIPFIFPKDGQGVFGQPFKINSPFAPVVNQLSSNNKPILCDERTERVLRKRNRKRQV
jgi:hypothetical protein